MKKEIIIAANINYGGANFNTKLILEYKHTGIMYFKNNGKHQLSCKNSAIEHHNKGVKIKENSGYFYIDRIAIPTENGDKWYINNEGDSYAVNRISKYGKKVHAVLSQSSSKKFSI